VHFVKLLLAQSWNALIDPPSQSGNDFISLLSHSHSHTQTHK
jgi:hypothetical protein